MLGTELLILGLLRRAPLSAYSLDRAVRAHVPLYRPFKHGNIYHAVSGFAEKGLLLRSNAKSKRGPQTTKTVFRLSAAGERRFHALLRFVLADVQADDPTLEIALVLLGQISRNQARALLADRSKLIRDQEKRLERIVGDVKKRMGAGYLAMLHTFARVRAEGKYLRDAIALLDNQKWNADWISDDGAIEDPARKL
jgi:DNA-binding PadR family transcriptional regulator